MLLLIHSVIRNTCFEVQKLEDFMNSSGEKEHILKAMSELMDCLNKQDEALRHAHNIISVHLPSHDIMFDHMQKEKDGICCRLLQAKNIFIKDDSLAELKDCLDEIHAFLCVEEQLLLPFLVNTVQKYQIRQT